MMNIVDLAHEIIRMDQRIRELECENEQLRQVEKDHNQFLRDTMSHNDQMLWNLMEMGLKVAETHSVEVIQ
jgi:hypothetical protein